MFLSARILSNLTNVNNYEYDTQATFSQGDTVIVYIQLIDLNKDRPGQGFNPTGKRYVPAAGAGLHVTIPSIDSSKILTKVATQPFAGDASIWAFTVLAGDALGGTYTPILALTESGVVTNGKINNGLSIQPTTGSYT